MSDDDISSITPFSLEERMIMDLAEVERRYKDFAIPDLTRDVRTLRELTAMAWPLLFMTSWKHYDIPKNTKNLIKLQREQENCVIFYDAIHRSLAETVLIPFVVNVTGRNIFKGDFTGGYIPTMLMGNNLVRKDKGPKERKLAEALERANVVALVERLNNKRQQADRVAFDTYTRLSRLIPVSAFPGGTRTRNGKYPDFFPAVYQGVIDAAKELSNPKAPHRDIPVYIVHINIDYSKTLEVKEFVSETHNPNVPHNFSFKEDFRKFMKNPGHVYISLSEPIKVNPYDNRKDLAKRSLEECKQLVKILPINIMSKAIVRMDPEPGSDINMKELYYAIDDVIEDTLLHQHKFRRVTFGNPKKIIKNSRIPVDSRLMETYNVYANYISHYFSENR